ncbi:unnamed protein product [Penicillium salamii]|uniref:Cytochrome P450 n=1 Tax=Penicillium salamii TaxID=1612424 RepID=A0A9W4NNX0_9EURO|nr:unnamed protein product [Penicillium salamii]
MRDWNPFLVCICGTLFATFLSLIVHTFVRPSRVPVGLEWTGRRLEFLGDIRACLREYTAGMTTILSGYKRFSLNGKPFIMPGTGFKTEVMLPPEHIKWVVDQPEDILSHQQFQAEKVGIKYFLPGFDLYSPIAAVEALRLHLTRSLGKIQGDLVDELRRSVDAQLGVDEEWKEVNLHNTLNNIVFRTSGRVLFGKSLARNDKFMYNLMNVSTWFGAGMLFIGQLCPWQLRRVLGLLFSIPILYHRSVCTRYLLPYFVERLNNMQRKRQDPSFDYSPPEDMITWTYRAAFDMKDEQMDSEKDTVNKFTTLIAGAIASSTVGASNAILDLISSDPHQNYYHLLREECESAFQTNEDWNSSATLLKLHRLDSAIRESLRRSAVIVRGLSRMVMPKDGVTLPSGQHLPQGWMIGFPIPAIHTDSRYYDEPDVYNPFRFLPTKSTPRSMIVTTSQTFLPFGHARHSCPGRWFASHLLKLLLSYIIINYDIEPLRERPLNITMGDLVFPPPGATIRLRRRERKATQS